MQVEAIVFTGPGGPEVITVGTTPLRRPGPGEVVVEVVAAGVNRADVLQRRGLYPAPTGTVADVPGLELSGRVAERGPGAQLFAVGAEVMAVVAGGAMARQIVVHERELMPVPHGVDLIEAAAIPEAFLTAWDALGQADLRAGEVVLIHAAASGVGCAALQLAAALGADALATSRHAAKLDRLTQLGLRHRPIVVTEARFAAEVSALTGGAGAAVILDCVGAAYLEENVRALARGGRMVLIGTLGGGTGSLPLTMLLGKRATLIGTVLRSRPLEEKITLARAGAQRLVPMFERGLLRPIIDQVLPMTDLAAAHARMEADANVGKLVLRW
jgi:NADPH2:quinone reductase